MGATRLSLEENLKRAYEKIYSASQELKAGDLGLFWNSSLDSLMQAVISKIGKMISGEKTPETRNRYYGGYDNHVSEFEKTFEFLPCANIPTNGELILAKKDIFYRDRDFSSIITKAGKTIEFLYIKPDGIAFLTLQSFTDTGRVTTRVCSYSEEKEFFLFNLPFFEYSIINDKGEEKEKLEKIVKDNPTSTIAQIYRHIDQNKDVVINVEKLFQEAEEQYNGEGKTKRNIGSCGGSVEGALESFGNELSVGVDADMYGRNYWNFSLAKEEEKLVFTNKAKRYFMKPLNSPHYYGNGINLYDYSAFVQPYSFEVRDEGIANIQYVEPRFDYVEPPQGVAALTVLKLMSEEAFKTFMKKNYKIMFEEVAKNVIETIDAGTSNSFDRNRDNIKYVLKFDPGKNLVYALDTTKSKISQARIEVLKLKDQEEKIEILFTFPNKANGDSYTHEELAAKEFLEQFMKKFPFNYDIEVSKKTIVENIKRNIVNANARYRNANSSLDKVRELYKPLEEITNFIISAYRSEIFIKMI